MSACTPRVYGNSPGLPRSRCSGRSSLVYSVLTSMPESVKRRGSSGPTTGATERSLFSMAMRWRLRCGRMSLRDLPPVDALASTVDAPRAVAVAAARAVLAQRRAALLAVAALGGAEVVVSRGQLVEIGGGFRVPDVIAQAGVRLVEVGTTNRTRLSDYADAIGADTGAVLRVHRSNFVQLGFVEETPIESLCELGVPV